MIGMDLFQWIAKYERKTGEKFERDERFELFFLPEKGFCEVGQLKDMLIINQRCGDLLFWRDKINSAARKAGGIKACGTWCIRKEIKAYIRLLGYRIEKTVELADGARQYICIHKDTGKMGRVSPAFKYKKSGRQAYFITWEP